MNTLKKKLTVLIQWATLLINPNQREMPFLLLEIGNLQVYCFQTRVEWDLKIPYKKVFWREVTNFQEFGPFPSINEAMNHYKYIQEVKKNDIEKKVIKVDFITKKKLGYLTVI